MKNVILLAVTLFSLGCSNAQNLVESNLPETVKGKFSGDSLSLNYQFRGRFYAYSSENYAEPSNGEAHSSNVAKELKVNPTRKEVYLIVDHENLVMLTDSLVGHNVYLVNNSGEKQDFNAQDSRLNISTQVLDEKGEWKSISFLPSSQCGNSYHTIYLGNEEYWKFVAPVFKGEFQTKMRYAIRVGDRFIFSNVFNCSVNYNQFNSKFREGYTPRGIMDPYNE